MIRVFFALVLFSFSGSAFAVPVDGPWDKNELDRRLSAELTVKGTLDRPFPEKSLIEEADVAPCWTTEPRRADEIKFENRSILVAPTVDSASLRIRAIQYYFRENEPDYQVRLSGEFSPQTPPQLLAYVCKEGCTEQPIDLAEGPQNQWEGMFAAPQAGAFVKEFILRLRGPAKVESLSVSRPDSYVASEVQDREAQTFALCVAPDNSMSEPVSASGYALILFANLAFLGAIAALIAARAYFPVFLLGSFYLTNVFGLAFLYFGLSEPRLIHGVTQRNTLVLLAMIDVMLLMAVGIGYGVVSALGKALPEKAIIPNTVDIRLAWLLFLTLNAVFAATQIQHTIAFVDAYSIDAAHASFVRNAIVSDTLGMKTHYFALLFEHIPVVLSLFIMADCLQKRRFLLAVGVVLLQGLMLVYNGEKAPFVWYLYASLFIGLSTINVAVRYWLCAVLAGIALVAMGMLFGPERILLLVDRAMFGGLTATYRVFVSFPDIHPFLEGRSMRFFGFGPDNFFHLDVFMWRRIFPELLFSNTTGTAAGAFWTQVYANFGLYPALMSGVLLGMLIAFYYQFAKALFSKWVFLAVAGWMVFNYAAVGESNFTRFAADFYLLSVFAFMILLVLVSAGTLKLKRRRENG